MATATRWHVDDDTEVTLDPSEGEIDICQIDQIIGLTADAAAYLPVWVYDLPAHRRGDDAGGGNTHRKGRPGAWPFQPRDDLQGLWAVPARAHAGRRERAEFRLPGSRNLNALRKMAALMEDMEQKQQVGWWVVTGSNRRHLRCKRSRPAPRCRNLANNALFTQRVFPVWPVFSGSRRFREPMCTSHNLIKCEFEAELEASA